MNLDRMYATNSTRGGHRQANTNSTTPQAKMVFCDTTGRGWKRVRHRRLLCRRLAWPSAAATVEDAGCGFSPDTEPDSSERQSSGSGSYTSPTGGPSAEEEGGAAACLVGGVLRGAFNCSNSLRGASSSTANSDRGSFRWCRASLSDPRSSTSFCSSNSLFLEDVPDSTLFAAD